MPLSPRPRLGPRSWAFLCAAGRVNKRVLDLCAGYAPKLPETYTHIIDYIKLNSKCDDFPTNFAPKTTKHRACAKHLNQCSVSESGPTLLQNSVAFLYISHGKKVLFLVPWLIERTTRTRTNFQQLTDKLGSIRTLETDLRTQTR